jgi:hypothetical protein
MQQGPGGVYIPNLKFADWEECYYSRHIIDPLRLSERCDIGIFGIVGTVIE